MSKALEAYYQALSRLIHNEPLFVPKNSKITNDSVALEAQRSRGAIKKGYVKYQQLILDIKNAETERLKNLKPTRIRIKNDYKLKYEKTLKEIESLKSERNTLLIQISSLIYENNLLQKEIQSFERDVHSNLIKYRN